MVLAAEGAALKAADRVPFTWLSLSLCPLEACDWFLQHASFSGDKDQKNENPKAHRTMGTHEA